MPIGGTTNRRGSATWSWGVLTFHEYMSQQRGDNAMSNVILSVIGWGLFYWVVYLYIFWVLVERAFFAGSDPECWDPNARTDMTHSTRDDPEPGPHFPYISTLGRPA